MSENLNKLYPSIILEHNKNPFHFEKKSDAQHIIEAYNPICGDKFKVFLDIKDRKVQSIHFHGYGCALSKASTSILLEKMEHQNINEISNIISSFLGSLQQNTPLEDPMLQPLSEVKNFEGRMKCVTLSWEALNAFLATGMR